MAGFGADICPHLRVWPVCCSIYAASFARADLHSRRANPCTDFFGVANFANSPLPSCTITGFAVTSPGIGYSAISHCHSYRS